MTTVVQATMVDPAIAQGGGQRVVQASHVQQGPAPIVMGQVVQGQVVGNPVGAMGPQPMYVSAYGAGFGGGHGEEPSGPVDQPICAALLACVCCCPCLGIVAICKATEVGRANSLGDFALARKKRKEAMIWIYATMAVGFVIYALNMIVRLTSPEASQAT
mmetsp:Transcript_28429/g.79524  ORF Transcript_28429/g.79524 Transcript_28429/m.79524 type:complete len:160 (-) Transcript_28429:283-762(-)